jgi:hypothetical protein
MNFDPNNLDYNSPYRKATRRTFWIAMIALAVGASLGLPKTWLLVIFAGFCVVDAIIRAQHKNWVGFWVSLALGGVAAVAAYFL